MPSRLTPKLLSPGIALLAIFCASNVAWAQNVTEGARIACQWCSGCHRVDNESPASADSSFAAVAHMSSTTASSLAVFLTTPHPNMPDYSLSWQEIRDVSAYILSLRKLP